MPLKRRITAASILADTKALRIALASALILVGSAGCEQARTSPRGQSRQGLLGRADRSEALLGAAINQLRDLPSYGTTELRLPEVILDSTKSSDGEDVMAICTANPALPDGPINYFTVREGNARFRSLGVKPGDIVKFSAGFNPESLEAGFEERVVLELVVAQVLDENTLIVENSLNQEATMPAKVEIWRYVDDRLVEIRQQLLRYVRRRLPPLNWQPSPDAQAIDQIVVHINQWLHQSEPKVEWQVDPLLETLDTSLAEKLESLAIENPDLAPYLTKEGLAWQFFLPYDGRLLQEAVWLRDIGRWAHGESFEKLARAEALFDWTVRNIQLVRDADGAAERPWQTLLYGRGTAEQRAWVFALLARHQGLDVVVLGLSPPGDHDSQSDAEGNSAAARFWLPALVDQGELYLFDSRLGLPIPGPEHQGVATLKQVQQGDGLLRALDLDDTAYSVSSDAAKNVVPYVVADPFELTRRARQVETKLAGDDRLALSVRASELADQLRSIPEISDVRIWDVPFRILAEQLTLPQKSGEPKRLEAAIQFEPFASRPVLWKARTRHFQGRKEIADVSERTAAEELTDDHREATQLYMHKSIRPTNREIEASGEEEARIRRTAKLAATYWQGLLAFDDGKYDVAAHWLARPELTAADSPWATGARYNLARTREAQGNIDEAVALLEKDDSPQQHGNKLRAKWLKERPMEKEQ